MGVLTEAAAGVKIEARRDVGARLPLAMSRPLLVQIGNKAVLEMMAKLAAPTAKTRRATAMQ